MILTMSMWNQQLPPSNQQLPHSNQHLPQSNQQLSQSNQQLPTVKNSWPRNYPFSIPNSRKHDVPEMVHTAKTPWKTSEWKGHPRGRKDYYTWQLLDGPNKRVEKVETYAEKVSAGVKIAEASRAGVSMATLAPITIRAKVPKAEEAFFPTKKLI